MINNVTLVGRLTNDIELRYTPNGVASAKFRLAVNRSFKNQQNEQQADFINVKVWRKQAENAAKERLLMWYRWQNPNRHL